MPVLNTSVIRTQFPALSRQENGRPVAWFDGPGGSQVPQSVIDAISSFLTRGGSNHGGAFTASRDSETAHEEAREAVADLFGARPDDYVAFGMNMTSLNFALSRALSANWVPGDEVVVTRLDHDANVSPWLRAAADRGATIRWVPFDIDTYRLDLERLSEVVGPRTQVVAITHASNAIGTIVDIAAATQIAHDAGALVVVDAVHYAPHGRIDIASTDCDFLLASAYKFFGPHLGAMAGRGTLFEKLDAYKVRPAPATGPGKWETGTQSFEALPGVTAAIDHIASLSGTDGTRRERLDESFAAIGDHAISLGQRFLDGLPEAATVFGITDDLAARTPTYAIELNGYSARRLATELGDRGIFVTNGDYYAMEVMSSLDRADGGLVRIGFLHYTTDEEVDRLLEALHDLAGNG
ncbi:MAG: cysteine desulfurase-like protein [Acidimicrobiia bacterium]|nr:cysteine desulfurase-like protein [Acidimicrobiia bacterium]